MSQPFLPRARRAILAEDLRAYLSDIELAFLVAQAACSVKAGQGEQAPWDHALLEILIFSYATGCYASDEIERALYDNAYTTVPDILFEIPSPSAVLRRFRRLHRHDIEQGLTEVLQRTLANQGWRAADFREEAVRRLNRAIQSDCWAQEM